MILTQLMPHQRAALDSIKSRNFALLMFPGSGKSVVALAHAERMGAKTILITSDKNNVLNTWPDQIDMHTSGWEYHVRPTPTRIRKLSTTHGNMIVIANYDYVSARWEQLLPLNFDMWIGDESLEFKDCRTVRYRHLKHLTQKIPTKLILNGTPMTEDMEDLYGQFSLIDEGGRRIGRSLTQFRTKYMQPDQYGYGWVPQKSAYTRFQVAVGGISHWLTTKPADVVMPEIKYATVEVPPTPTQVEIDRRLCDDFRLQVSDKSQDLKYAVEVFGKRHQLTGGMLLLNDDFAAVTTNKRKALIGIIEKNCGAKIVVWHRYVLETGLIKSALLREGMGSSSLFGGVYVYTGNPSILEQFAKANAGILLIRTSMCKGLNQLADADIAIFWSHPTSYAQRCQAIGRSRRLSSTTTVTWVVDMITKGGVDEKIHAMLSQKKNFALTFNNMAHIVSPLK